ncbi:MAG: hypothetical protein NXI31_07930 [bacterium]|nr:hypothetical protein [bacterium]
MKQPVLLAVLALAGMAVAQRGPLPGLPVVPSPVQHPALLAQPLLQPDNAKTPATPKTGGQTKGQKNKPAKNKKPRRKRPVIDPATVGVKVKGRALKQRVERVLDLDWHEVKKSNARGQMLELEAQSAATGKPILFLQALGCLDDRA